MPVVIIAILFIFFLDLTCYTFLTPYPEQKPLQITSFDKYLGRVAYIAAYILSLLRAPLGLLPYLAKLFIFFALSIRYESAQTTYFRELINMVGDCVNLAFTALVILFIFGPPRIEPLSFLLYLPIGAEFLRLISERVPIMFSAVWQVLPHRRCAQLIQSRQHSGRLARIVASRFTRYCDYYELSDTRRTEHILCTLKHRAVCDKEMSKRLEYIQSFRIIPQSHGLRGGRVRDVARAEVFIHGIWTNDPWLLTGMAIRRAPWMFDPRYVRRPFYYMTEANRIATLFVLEHARYSLPYAIFQFGHEIRVARLHFFYRLLRLLRADVEEKVLADGTFQFDQFIFWLARRQDHKQAMQEQRYLYTDDEVIEDLLSRQCEDQELTTIEVAARYTYPVKYVEEVLLKKIEAAKLQR
jgi:hypothetical protein